MTHSQIANIFSDCETCFCDHGNGGTIEKVQYTGMIY